MMLRSNGEGKSLGERLFQQFVDHARISLALHGLHHLADEETEQFVLAAAIFGDLVGVGGDHVGDGRVDRSGVAGLLEAALLDDPGRVVAGFEHDLEDLLGERP